MPNHRGGAVQQARHVAERRMSPVNASVVHVERARDDVLGGCWHRRRALPGHTPVMKG